MSPADVVAGAEAARRVDAGGPVLVPPLARNRLAAVTAPVLSELGRILVALGMVAFVAAVEALALFLAWQAPRARSFVELAALGAASVGAAAGLPTVQTRLRRLAYRLGLGAGGGEVLAQELARSWARGAYELTEVLPRLAWTLAQGAGAREAVVWLRVEGELRPAAAWPGDAVHQPLKLKGEQPPPIPHAARSYPVVDGGELLGVLAISKRQGDRLTPAEDRLIGDLAAKAALVLRNVRLVEDLRASRQRLVVAADEERRRVERNLHDGAQQRLLALSMALSLIRGGVGKDPDETLAAGLDEAIGELKTALSDLRDLARGIHPAILTEAGLGPALQSLADRSQVPAKLLACPEERFDPTVEATVYYVVSEALQNVAKYADARAARIRAERDGDRIVVEVTDDGVGGADPAGGSGLRGLLDRVAAVGGRLTIESPPGQGTTLTAEVPCR